MKKKQLSTLDVRVLICYDRGMQAEFSEIMNNLSENARFALQKADFYSKRYNNGYMGTEHLLMGIMSMDTSTGARLVRDEGATLEEIEKALNKVAVEVPGSDMAMMSLSEAVILTLRMAQGYVKEQGLRVIGTEHILYALLSQPNSRAALILNGLKVDGDRILDEIEALVEEQTKDEKLKAEKAKYLKKSSLKFLSRYGKDLTEEARAGKLDAVIGRENEIERVVTVLSRRTKSNPVLIGEAGVGKTAIVEGLATRIAKNEVPENLIGKHIYQVDLSSVVAGTKFRGEFEERIKGIVDEATGDESILLFIDEIHLLCGAGSSEGSMDAANILKPALARNSINLIGATTLDEYRKTIEKDKALSRRFQAVIVEEPSAAVTLRILKGIKSHYEKHHGVVIPDAVLETAITMSQRYINDRFMPDKVIDIIDEAAAICKVAADKKGGGKYKKMKIEKSALENKIIESAEKEDYEKAANYKTELAKLEQEMKKLEKAGAKKTEHPKLLEEHLATAVALKTGIPVSKVHGSEMKMLLGLEDELKKSVIGQDEAIGAVAKAIRRGRSGIADARRPIGSFIFMGPTGVGKTELARVIAREVFGGENALVKIDMSEFGEKHNVSRLLGAPAGYIGYDDGGKLTEAVRRKPYSVILFDEIEKAHPDVFNLLLQILEDGVLTDGQGNKIKFNNTIVILTSNLGSADMYRESELGFAAKTAKDKKALAEEYEENKAYAMKALKKAMRPELINRLDGVLVFHALTKKDVEKIFDNLIDDLRKRLSTKGIGIKIDEKAKEQLIKEGYDPKNGARPLRRKIEDEVEALLSEEIISGKLVKGDIPTLKYLNKQYKLVKE
ncbi:ATP-dependent Clp protease ATP-binding subunit [Candidatus Saccharibacteria bacterium]|nr:ATP-dependent Clp protease ATP-binding subunit [Candidatus Saccharibacteria bacterium]